MNELHGFGPMQPLRPGATVRPQIPLAAPEAIAPEARDEVNLRVDLPAPPALSGPQAPVVQLPAGPQADLPAAKLSGAFGPREVQDFDGFLVASTPNVGSVSSLSPQVQVTGLGPIAMIDEPAPQTHSVQFPELSLNGPSTVGEGLFGLSGQRLA